MLSWLYLSENVLCFATEDTQFHNTIDNILNTLMHILVSFGCDGLAVMFG